MALARTGENDSPYEFCALRTKRRLSEECCDELMTSDLVDLAVPNGDSPALDPALVFLSLAAIHSLLHCGRSETEQLKSLFKQTHNLTLTLKKSAITSIYL